MELLSAIQLEPFERVKEIAKSMKSFSDAEYSDYQALNLALELNRKRIASYLISIDCRVNVEEVEPENTPLHNAVELGDRQIVCDLLMKKASVTALNHEGNTPLHLAFLRRYNKITELILNVMFVEEFSDYTNVKNKQGLSHLHIACTMDNERLVQFFLKAGANVKDAVSECSPYFAGYTAMHFAVENRCIEVAKMLLDAGGVTIISEGADSEGRSPAHLAFQNLRDMQILFYHMTMQDKDDEWGYYKFLSQFHIACLGDYPEIVEGFISHGAAVNTPLEAEAVFCPGYTPLHCAVESNCKKNVELLLKSGAKVDQMNCYNMTPLHLALYNERPGEEDTIVDLLYAATEKKKKDVVDLNDLGYMHVAVTRGDLKTVKAFLKVDPKFVDRAVMYNLRNFSGFTALHFAVKYEQPQMALLLINHGAVVNANDDFEGGTPLHLAFQAGNRKLIDLLLANGARADATRASDDKTMLHLLVEDYVDQAQARQIVESEGNVFDYWKAKDELLGYIETLVRLKCDVNGQDSEEGNTALHLACHEFRDGAPCFRKLLEFGANVNMENFMGLTAFQCALHNRYSDNGSDYMTFYHHVQKLKALELEVNPKNEQCCEEVLQKRSEWEKYTTFTDGVNFFSEEELERKHRERLDEVARMKHVKLNEKVSLYDFVRFDGMLATAYVQNKALAKFFNETGAKELNEQYPSYASIIKLRYRRAVESFVLNGPAMKAGRGVVAAKGRGGVQRRK